MKQQQHDINFEEDSEKKSESQIGFEPTTLKPLKFLFLFVTFNPLTREDTRPTRAFFRLPNFDKCVERIYSYAVTVI